MARLPHHTMNEYCYDYYSRYWTRMTATRRIVVLATRTTTMRLLLFLLLLLPLRPSFFSTCYLQPVGIDDFSLLLFFVGSPPGSTDWTPSHSSFSGSNLPRSLLPFFVWLRSWLLPKHSLPHCLNSSDWIDPRFLPSIILLDLFLFLFLRNRRRLMNGPPLLPFLARLGFIWRRMLWMVYIWWLFNSLFVKNK